jgi:hypothetical protein
MDAGSSLEDLLGQLEAASLDLEDRLVSLRVSLNETRALLQRDLPLSQALAHSHCPAARAAAAAAAEELIDLLHDYRAETVRQLVDVEGWTLTEIAKSSGNARQVVARLYHFAQEAPVGADQPGRSRARPPAKITLAHPERGDE